MPTPSLSSAASGVHVLIGNPGHVECRSACLGLYLRPADSRTEVEHKTEARLGALVPIADAQVRHHPRVLDSRHEAIIRAQGDRRAVDVDATARAFGAQVELGLVVRNATGETKASACDEPICEEADTVQLQRATVIDPFFVEVCCLTVWNQTSSCGVDEIARTMLDLGASTAITLS